MRVPFSRPRHSQFSRTAVVEGCAGEPMSHRVRVSGAVSDWRGGVARHLARGIGPGHRVDRGSAGAQRAS